MRLTSVTGADAGQAMARLRAALGDEAIIVATQELAEGGVRITGAVENADLDLAALLAPGDALAPWSERLAAVIRHHELPEGLCQRLQAAVTGLAEDDPTALLAHACHTVLRFAPLPVPGPRPLLLAGPPGAGKTTAVAKLAARAVIAGQRVEVVSTDSGRAGGLEQLAALLAPLGLSPRSAAQPGALKAELATIGGADLVLIDSAGVNPYRSADIGRLSQVIGASGAELVLVLAAGGAVADSAEIGQTFVALGAGRLLATRLDAARRFGGLLAAASAGLALGEAGIGPTIGQGLGALSARGLARLMLHAEGATALGRATLNGEAT